MMKKGLQLISLLFFSLGAFSQRDSSICFTYDFKTRTLENKLVTIAENDSVIIKLSHYNPFLYTYSLKTDYITYNSEIPKLLKNGDGGLLNLSGLLSKILISSDSKVLLGDIQKKVNAIQIDKLVETTQKIEATLKKIYNSDMIFPLMITQINYS